MSNQTTQSQENQNENKEQKLLKHILSLPENELNSIKGNPEKVLNLIEQLSSKYDIYMNVGPYKGDIIVKKIKEEKPTIMIELGCYIGYSAIKFSKEIIGTNAKYITFEVNLEFANISSQLIDLAGLTNKVEIIVGEASEMLVKFATESKQFGSSKAIDFIFIDHLKEFYLPDLRIMESLNLVAPGTIIVADNISFAPTKVYVNYVQSSPENKRDYNNSVKNIKNPKYIGRWNLLYESETIHTVDPNGIKDAIEITKCIEYLNG